MLIKRFAENDKQKWCELSSGQRVVCDEEIINALWRKWIVSKGAIRADTKEFTVFEFIIPIEIENILLITEKNEKRNKRM